MQRVSYDFSAYLKMVKEKAEKEGGIKLSEGEITYVIANSIPITTVVNSIDEIRFQKFGAVLDVPIILKIARKKKLI